MTPTPNALQRRLPRVAPAALAAASVALAGCAALFTDPATRLAACVIRAAREVDADGQPRTVQCAVRAPGAYTVVLHPNRAVSDAELLAAGFPPQLLLELRQLQLYDGEAVYVVAHDRRDRSNRTAIGWKYATTPNLLVLTKPPGAGVEVDVSESAYGVAVAAIR